MTMRNLGYKYNARHLDAELSWFREVVKTRHALHHGQPCDHGDVTEIPVPGLNGHPSQYQQALAHLRASVPERLIVVLALIPHIHPNVLDDFLASIDPRFGGDKLASSGAAFVPTVETALFLLAGDDLEQRFLYLQLFEPDAPLLRNKVIELQPSPESSSLLDARLHVSREFLALVTHGKSVKPEYGHEFPAKELTTEHEWDDLVLPAVTWDQIDEIKTWMKHGDTILYDWGLRQKLAPGYRCLFYGPPGTGKSMTAALLGKEASVPVYRIDLALVVSKYVGETEKNLRKIFDVAHDQRWILFFDEAEALFSKRTNVKDAHDRYANQEVAYLLQRIEDYTGVAILATNMRQNLDEAFTRRFQNLIHFPMPGKWERQQIWQKGFSKRCVLERALDLEKLAEDYELAGGSIMNVVRYASLKAVEAGSNVILRKDTMRGIQREFTKEGKSL